MLPKSVLAVPHEVGTLSVLLESRYSCRAFLPESLPAGAVEQVIERALLAPSWCNAQPWHVHVVEGNDALTLGQRLHALAEAGASGGSDIPFPSAYEGVYRDRRHEQAALLYGALGIERDDRTGRTRQLNENYRFFGAPHILVVSVERALGPYAILDCGAFITVAMLAATELGFGVIAEAAPAYYAAAIRQALDIPDSRDVVAVIALGREDRGDPANGYRTGRAELNAVMTRVDRIDPNSPKA